MEFPEEAIFMLTDVKSWLGPLTLVKCWDILSYHFTFSPEQLFPWTAALVWIWFTSSWPSGEISEKHPLSRSLASANPKGRMSSGSIWEPQPSLWLFCSLPIYCSHHCVGWVHLFTYSLVLWLQNIQECSTCNMSLRASSIHVSGSCSFTFSSEQTASDSPWSEATLCMDSFRMTSRNKCTVVHLTEK